MASGDPTGPAATRGLGLTVTLSGKLFDPATAGPIIKQQVVEAIAGIALNLQKEIQMKAPVGVSSQLKGSFVTVFAEEGMKATIGSPLLYATPVELGRKPKWVPIAPLELWFRRKLGLDPKEARSAAFALSRKKALSRTPGQDFFYSTIERMAPALVAQFFGACGPAIAAELST